MSITCEGHNGNEMKRHLDVVGNGNNLNENARFPLCVVQKPDGVSAFVKDHAGEPMRMTASHTHSQSGCSVLRF